MVYLRQITSQNIKDDDAILTEDRDFKSGKFKLSKQYQTKPYIFIK